MKKLILSIYLVIYLILFSSCNTNTQVEPIDNITKTNETQFGDKSSPNYPTIELSNYSSLNLSNINLSDYGLTASQVQSFQNTTYTIGGAQYQADMIIADNGINNTKIIIFEPNSTKIHSTVYINNNVSTGIQEVTYRDANDEIYMEALLHSDNTIQITYTAPELQQKGFTRKFSNCVWETANTITSSNFWSGVMAVGMVMPGGAKAIVAGLAIGCTIHAIS